MATKAGTRTVARVFSLDELVRRVGAGEVRFPHFGRGFAWRRSQVVDLVDSVRKGFPIGSLLLWERAAEAQRITLGGLVIDAPALDRSLWVVDGLQEFTRRLVFCVLISNGNAHLKNWSLIYADPRIPTISPAYDLLSTRWYMGEGEELGLKFGGSKSFERFQLSTFDRLERRLGVDTGLADIGRTLVDRVVEHWPEIESTFDAPQGLVKDIERGINDRAVSMRSSA